MGTKLIYTTPSGIKVDDYINGRKVVNVSIRPLQKRMFITMSDGGEIKFPHRSGPFIRVAR